MLAKIDVHDVWGLGLIDCEKASIDVFVFVFVFVALWKRWALALSNKSVSFGHETLDRRCQPRRTGRMRWQFGEHAMYFID